MVPPIYLPANEQGIVRTGLQQTYVFYRSGIETLVIHPGFTGNVDEFGMLIPFPTVPAIRKVPDNTFQHIKAIIDPPEIIVDLRPSHMGFFGGGMGGGGYGGAGYGGEGMGMGMGMELAKDETRVVKEEAVGMYDVAVLRSGSSVALERWMKENQYRYPTGMDTVCEEYIQDKWCFVAVRARIGHKALVDPQPGQQAIDDRLQPGTSFDGHVQAMGFRFRVNELIVPMRLSTYNEGDLHNVVYVLSDRPLSIEHVDQSFVRRQLSGDKLLKHITSPLPLRIFGGDASDIPNIQRQILHGQRNTTRHMQSAIDLIRGDLRCAINNRLSNREEELEKDYLVVSERLGLRGEAIDALHREAVVNREAEASTKIMDQLSDMTLTVIDGDFPRDVLARENLAFVEYRMPSSRNSPKLYDARELGPGRIIEDESLRYEGKLSLSLPALRSTETIAQSTNAKRDRAEHSQVTQVFAGIPRDPAIGGEATRSPTVQRPMLYVFLVIGSILLLIIGASRKTSIRWARFGRLGMCILFALTLTTASRATTQESSDTSNPDRTSIKQLFEQLANADSAPIASEQLVALGDRQVNRLSQVASNGTLLQRGWAIICLSEIGSQAAKSHLQRLAKSEQDPLVQAWIAAALVSLASDVDELLKLPPGKLAPELERPFRNKLNNLLAEESTEEPLAQLLVLSQAKPQAIPVLQQAIVDASPEALASVCYSHPETSVRRLAAGYLAAKAESQPRAVAKTVIKALGFDASVQSVPWRGGPLFIPNIAWSSRDATELFVELSLWSLWAEQRAKTGSLSQIQNNMRDIARFASIGGDTTHRVVRLQVVSMHVDFTELVQTLQSLELSVAPEINDFMRDKGSARRAYDIQQFSRTQRSRSRRQPTSGMGGGGYGYTNMNRLPARLCWVLQESSSRSQVTVFDAEGGLTTKQIPRSDTIPVDDRERILEMASVRGNYRELLHEVNAPQDMGSYGLFNEFGLFESPPNYRGYKQLETGYWVYVYPTWYVWRHNDG